MSDSVGAELLAMIVFPMERSRQLKPQSSLPMPPPVSAAVLLTMVEFVTVLSEKYMRNANTAEILGSVVAGNGAVIHDHLSV